MFAIGRFFRNIGTWLASLNPFAKKVQLTPEATPATAVAPAPLPSLSPGRTVQPVSTGATRAERIAASMRRANPERAAEMATYVRQAMEANERHNQILRDAPPHDGVPSVSGDIMQFPHVRQALEANAAHNARVAATPPAPILPPVYEESWVRQAREANEAHNARCRASVTP